MSKAASAIDKNLIRDLAEILNDTNLSEIEIETGATKIRVSRSAPVAAPVVGAYQVPQPAAVAAPAPVSEAAAPASAANNHANAVKSPMVGTAYLAPAPGKPPFVTVGQTVKKGDTLLIVEAMKTMNNIAAPQAGVVKEIIVHDAQPVEFGEALVIIE